MLKGHNDTMKVVILASLWSAWALGSTKLEAPVKDGMEWNFGTEWSSSYQSNVLQPQLMQHIIKI